MNITIRGCTGKLVRNHIPDIIREHDCIEPYVLVLNMREYTAALQAKLLEEAHELREEHEPDKVLLEAADVLQVVHGLAEVYKHPWASIVRSAERYVQKNGHCIAWHSGILEIAEELASSKRMSGRQIFPMLVKAYFLVLSGIQEYKIPLAALEQERKRRASARGRFDKRQFLVTE